MHPRKRFALPVVLVLVTLISVTVQVQQSSYAAAAKLVEDARARLGAPGVSVAIAAHDRLVYSTGFGLADVENQVPASATTVYRIASISKTMVATAVMQLVESGRVSLDDPIQKYVPSYPDKGGLTITIRHILTHTSGIRHYKPGEMANHQRYDSIEEAIKIFKDDPLLFTPGAKYSYSTYAFNLLAGVVERAAGLTFEAYLQEHLWGPAGMTRTRLEHPQEIVPNRARQYAKAGGAAGVSNAPYADLSVKWAGGGIISTAEDLVRFHIALDEGRLLAPATLEQMYTPGTLNDGTRIGYGLGWFVQTDQQGRRWISHSGGATGGTTFLLRDPEAGLAVAILCNVENAGNLNALAHEVAEAVLKVSQTPPREAKPAKSGRPVGPAPTSRLRIARVGERLKATRSAGDVPSRKMIVSRRRSTAMIAPPVQSASLALGPPPGSAHRDDAGRPGPWDGERHVPIARRRIREVFAHGAEPQTEPPPYHEQEVKIASGNVALAGTLTIPAGRGPFPAVVMFTGSGPQNRDEELFGFRPFRIIADHLARHGVAALRCDDRGVGGSSGSTSESTTEDLAADALAEVTWLATRPEIDSKQIGALGHSEGALVAALAASRSSSVAFVVLLAGTSVSGERIVRAQAEAIAREQGASDEEVAKLRAQQDLLFKAIRTGEGWDATQEAARALGREQIARLPEVQRQAIADPDKVVDAAIERQLASAKSRWYRFFIDYDPAQTLSTLRCPVLALFGAKDLQAPAEMNRAAADEALKKAGNPDTTMKTYDGANHLFIKAGTGSPTEYPTLEKAFVPGLLDDVTDWILKRAR